MLETPEMINIAKRLTERDIVQFGENLKEEDVGIRMFKINYANGEDNPLNRINFYKSKEVLVGEPIE